MDHLIIGDIHGCFFTFTEMLKHWDRDKEYLISVGDLIDRGNYSALVVEECMKISNEYPNSIFLKGNHEAEIITHFEIGHNKNWMKQGGQKTLRDFDLNKSDLKDIIKWFKSMPLIFENETILVTHAGISATEDPENENNEHGVLWNRQNLKNMGKLQIHGHTPLKDVKPVYNNTSDSWNIDTGAVYGYGLTGLRISAKGRLIDKFHIKTDERDIISSSENME
ncbi:serine/threonine protein phosphatase 1 [Pedobacter cryoconitis]|uniref:Serine/threonine protein phosphatase 1 n=1 Tax=Pedobacter cryoconitis TaxID=188932 RepID=A0A7W9E2C4_9SPHI|nr:metallophosphoesterase family protein [Pedobacter cryoconitis]MBB5639144.1 serine/threonine protein phosphatase 1 [Pedobacter cryoconitis]